jgi:hypothetical protein
VDHPDTDGLKPQRKTPRSRPKSAVTLNSAGCAIS